MFGVEFLSGFSDKEWFGWPSPNQCHDQLDSSGVVIMKIKFPTGDFITPLGILSLFGSIMYRGNQMKNFENHIKKNFAVKELKDKY